MCSTLAGGWLLGPQSSTCSDESSARPVGPGQALALTYPGRHRQLFLHTSAVAADTYESLARSAQQVAEVLDLLPPPPAAANLARLLAPGVAPA